VRRHSPVLFRNADADHGAGVVSHAGEFGGLSPLLEDGKLDLNLDSVDSYRVDLRTDIRQVGLVRAADHPSASCSRTAGDTDREAEEVSRSSPAAGDPSFLNAS
jgi:hypothetical protein